MPEEKKIIFMGTPSFAVGCLTALYEAGYKIVGVVTQPDKPKGRSKALCPSPVKEEALRLGLPLFQPQRVRDEEFFKEIAPLAPDMIVVAAFGQIIPRRILDLPPFGCINVHASLLPRYRGAAPIQQAIMDGEKETGVTIMRMNEGLDTGDMISQEAIALNGRETGESLFDTLSSLGASLLCKTLPSIFDGTAVYTPQPAQSPTPYAAMIRKETGHLDFAKDAFTVHRLIRALSSQPGAYTYLDGKVLKILGAKALPSLPGKTGDEEPGRIVLVSKHGITVACGEGYLELTDVQLAGKKRMDAGAFLRGYHLEEGMKLGE